MAYQADWGYISLGTCTQLPINGQNLISPHLPSQEFVQTFLKKSSFSRYIVLITMQLFAAFLIGNGWHHLYLLKFCSDCWLKSHQKFSMSIETCPTTSLWPLKMCLRITKQLFVDRTLECTVPRTLQHTKTCWQLDCLCAVMNKLFDDLLEHYNFTTVEIRSREPHRV